MSFCADFFPTAMHKEGIVEDWCLGRTNLRKEMRVRCVPETVLAPAPPLQGGCCWCWCLGLGPKGKVTSTSSNRPAEGCCMERGGQRIGEGIKRGGLSVGLGLGHGNSSCGLASQCPSATLRPPWAGPRPMNSPLKARPIDSSHPISISCPLCFLLLAVCAPRFRRCPFDTRVF